MFRKLPYITIGSISMAGIAYAYCESPNKKGSAFNHYGYSIIPYTVMDKSNPDCITKKIQSSHDLNRSKKFEKCTEVINRFMITKGVPGLSIGVTRNGENIWSAGFGYADVEQMSPCRSDTTMRIASLSKSITAIMAAKLVQEGKLDLDASIQKYVPNFPEKTFAKETVSITCRQLLSHTSGIRHYNEDVGKVPLSGEQRTEFFYNKAYKNIDDALEMFMKDDLVAKPGTTFSYTTHGFTLLSAAIEKIKNAPIEKLFAEFFAETGMNHTMLEKNENITANRTRYYYRNENHTLMNAPEVDNSYKWAGGGIISNIYDMLIFGNMLLYSYRSGDIDPSHMKPKPYLHPLILNIFWQGQVEIDKDRKVYALGWFKKPHSPTFGGVTGSHRNGYWMHTGFGVGASSILLMKPPLFDDINSDDYCVAILANLHMCYDLESLALEIAAILADEKQINCAQIASKSDKRRYTNENKDQLHAHRFKMTSPVS